MKNIILASAIVLSSLVSFAPQSYAANVTVTTTERIEQHPGHRNMHKPRHHRQSCFVKKVKVRHHGRIVVKTTKVCR